MNYRERHEQRQEAARRRTRRSMRISMLIGLAAAGVMVGVKFFGPSSESKPAAGGSEVSSAVPSAVSAASQPVQPAAPTPWNLLLVNREHLLPEDFSTPYLEEVSAGQRVDMRIAEMTRKMLADAKEQGVTLQICSAYRSLDLQEKLYNREAAVADGEPVAVQRPGESEHNTGLAIDIVTPSFQRLVEGFEDTDAFRWLDEHAAEYGFILRYPRDKEAITGVIYEPWHYRYVGKEHAKVIHEKKLSLEEYLQIFQNQA